MHRYARRLAKIMMSALTICLIFDYLLLLDAVCCPVWPWQSPSKRICSNNIELYEKATPLIEEPEIRNKVAHISLHACWQHNNYCFSRPDSIIADFTSIRLNVIDWGKKLNQFLKSLYSYLYMKNKANVIQSFVFHF